MRYFDEAIANGFAVKDIAADRGLAYDLIGRNADAQKDYAIAIQNGENDELLTRYAVSLGISGDLAGSEEKLYSLLQKSDRTAWRNRVFILAMNEQTKEANKIARQTMTKRMAEALKPFLKRMPKLTAAQKAAAVHFGHFPASENVGVDVASVRFAANSAVRGGEGADAGLIPIGKPLGENAKKPRVLAMPDTSLRRRPGSAGNAATTPGGAVREITVLEGAKELPRPGTTISADRSAGTLIDNPARGNVESARPGFETAVTIPAQTREQPKSGAGTQSPPALVSQSVERKVEIAGVQPPTSANQPASNSSGSTGKKPVQLVDFDLATAGTGATGEPGTPIERKPLSDIIGAINIPEREKQSAVVPVDLARITPAKPQSVVEEAEEPVKAEPEHPRRFWVQLATGSNASALKFDYRRFARKNPDLFKGKEGWTSPWGRMTRLVVGPFEDLASAKKFEADFRKGGGDGFAWISADGTVVKQLTAK